MLHRPAQGLVGFRVGEQGLRTCGKTLFIPQPRAQHLFGLQPLVQFPAELRVALRQFRGALRHRVLEFFPNRA